MCSVSPCDNTSRSHTVTSRHLCPGAGAWVAVAPLPGTLTAASLPSPPSLLPPPFVQPSCPSPQQASPSSQSSDTTLTCLAFSSKPRDSGPYFGQPWAVGLWPLLVSRPHRCQVPSWVWIESFVVSLPPRLFSTSVPQPPDSGALEMLED